LRLLADMSVSRKLLLLVALGCAVAAIVAIVGLSGLSAVNGKVDDIYRGNLEPSAHLAAINSAALGIQADVANLALASGPVAAKSFRDRIAANDAELDRQVSSYRAAAHSAEKQRLIDRFDIWWTAFRNIRDHRLMPLAASGDAAAFQQAYLGDGQIVSGNATAALNDLLRYENDSGRAAASAAHSAYRTAQIGMLVALVLGLIVALALSRYLGRLISGPIRRMREVLSAVAAGDLTAEAQVVQRDEVGEMAAALSTATESTRHAVRSLGDNSQTLATAAEELTAISSTIAQSSTDASGQAGQVADAAAAVSEHVSAAAVGTEEMGASIEEIARSTSQAANVATSAVEIAGGANEIITKLGDASVEIGEVVKVITAVAEQTNLLALNATIEAARAGEYGKGFAVVASEVKELAQETGRATEDIGRRVAAIQAGSTDAVAAIGRVSEVIAQISEYQDAIAAAVEEQAATTRSISGSVSEAAIGVGGIAANVGNVARATDTTHTGVASTTEAVSELARMATEMRTLVSRFRY
jgi:methyl-accepting chemotaxis protein